MDRHTTSGRAGPGPVTGPVSVWIRFPSATVLSATS